MVYIKIIKLLKIFINNLVHALDVSMNGAQVIFVSLVGAALVLIVAVPVIYTLVRDDGNDGSGLQVIATFYPLYFFAGEVLGEQGSVSMLIPENSEPHAWEPSVSDVLKVGKADVFVYNGAGLEPWVVDFLSSIGNSDLVVVDSSRGLFDEDNGTQSSDENEHHDDPHFWLDPILAEGQVDSIFAGLVETDPDNEDIYVGNARLLKDRLEELNDEFVKGLEDRTKNDIVTTHDAFDHMADRYDFTSHAAIGVSADEQPSVEDLYRLARLVDDLDLHYVFVEPGYSDAYMGTISHETGAEVLVLDGIHGRSGVHSGLDYFEIMEENLKNLRIGLEVAP